MHSNVRKAFAAAAVAAVGAFAVAACGDSGSSDSGSSGSAAKTPQTIGVAVSVPLSGDSAETGTDMLHGAELAADYINSKGGIAAGPMKGAKLKVTGGDDAMSVKGALAVASKYVQNKDQWLLTGYLDSGMSLAAGQLAARQNLAVISSYACSTKLEAYKNIAIQCPLLAGIAAAATNFAIKDVGAKKLAIITTTEAFVPDYLKGIVDEAKKNNVPIATTQRFHLGSTTDFSALVENMKSSGADAVISLAYQADAGRILSTMRRTGYDVPFVDALGEGWDKAFYGAAGSAATSGDGAYATFAGEKFPEPGSLLEQQSKAFEAKYGKPIPTSAEYVFDSVLSGAAAIAAGASKREQVIDHYGDVSGQGLTGELKYGEGNRVAGARVTIAKVDGKTAAETKLGALYDVQGETATRVEQ